jgi:hypothetical protein
VEYAYPSFALFKIDDHVAGNQWRRPEPAESRNTKI